MVSKNFCVVCFYFFRIPCSLVLKVLVQAIFDVNVNEGEIDS